MNALIGFSDGARFADGAGLPAAPAIVTRRYIVFNCPSVGYERELIEHPSARAYRLGGGLFASIAPCAGGASVSLVDRITDETLSLAWTPARGFTPVDPTVWLSARGRGRLDAGSAEHTVLRLARLLPDLVSERGHLW